MLIFEDINTGIRRNVNINYSEISIIFIPGVQLTTNRIYYVTASASNVAYSDASSNDTISQLLYSALQPAHGMYLIFI